MKQKFIHTLFLFIALSSCASLFAQEVGTICENSYVVTDEFAVTLEPGTYWFTAGTYDLPLALTFRPSEFDPDKQELVATLDFGCYSQYDSVAELVVALAIAGDYEIPWVQSWMPTLNDTVTRIADLPLEEQQALNPDDVLYYLEYGEMYFDAFATFGFTQNISAWVKLDLPIPGTVSLQSASVYAKCAPQSTIVEKGSEYPVAKHDSNHPYLFIPMDMFDAEGVGQRTGLNFLWNGRKPANVYLWTDCDKTPIDPTWEYNRDADGKNGKHIGEDGLWFVATPGETTLALDTSSMNAYARYKTPYIFFTVDADENASFTLVNQDSVVEPVLLSFSIAGKEMTIDQENNLIEGETPANVSKALALMSGNYKAVVSPEGVALRFNESYDSLYVGTRGYLMNVSMGNDDGTKSSVAELAAIAIGEDLLEGFLSERYDYIVYRPIEEVMAAPVQMNASVEITQATAENPVATIVCTAEDGTTTLTYTVTFAEGEAPKVLNSDASLRLVYLDGERYNAFFYNRYDYEIGVPRAKDVPVLSADLTEATSKIVEIVQPTEDTMQGSILTQAEDGSGLTYTFRFFIDRSQNLCDVFPEEIALDEPVALSPLQPDTVLTMPAWEWASKYIQFSWSGGKPVKVYLSKACNFAKHSDEMLVDSLVLEMPRGEETVHRNLRPKDMQRLSRLSGDGNLYLQFDVEEVGTLTATTWEETCLTRSELIKAPAYDDIKPAVFYLTPESYIDHYKFYTPDFLQKNVQFVWEGDGELKAYVASTCDFRLTETNKYVAMMGSSPLSFRSGMDTVVVKAATWQTWHSVVDDFAYVRFLSSGTGTLTIEDADRMPTAVEKTAAEAGGEVVYYDLLGRRVDAPKPNGIYLRLQGSKAEKVIR